MTNLLGVNLNNGSAAGAKREGMENPSHSLASMPQYEDYVDSGVEWLGKVPTTWTIRKISHVFKSIGSGTTPSSGNVDYYDGKIPWVQTGDLNDGLLVETKKNISEKALKDLSVLRLYDKGSLIIALYGATIGKLSVLGISAATNQACCVMDKPIGADTKYVFYLFAGFKLNLISMAYGGGQPNISQDLIKSLRLPFPSIEEQTLIANFLDKKTAQIDDAIAIKEQQIELLKERKQIIIQQAVTQGLDPNVPMKDSGVDWIGKIPEHWEVRRSKFVFTQRKERAWKNDVQLSATQAYGVIPQDQYEQLTGKSVVKITLHLDKRKHVEKDDFVISMRSFQGGLERAWSQGCIRSSYIVLRSLEKIEPAFYGYLLKLPAYIAALQQTASFIRDGQDLNFENFSKVDLFIPPIEEQKEIASYVESFMNSSDKGIALLEAQIQKLKEYKTTLINSAVTGKIKITPELLAK